LPKREIPILAAGPAVSFALAAFGYFTLQYLAINHPDLVFRVRGSHGYDFTLLGHALDICFTMNLVLGIFNCIPIYPLDGGQIVHNILRLFIPDRKANKVALFLAFVFAVLFLGWLYSLNQQVDIYSCILIGWLLFNAHRYLG
jgi:Zn-dependent protease